MWFAKPAALWEFDEILFAHATRHFDPIAHHPPPPGYPLFIVVAQLVRHVMPSDFATLVAINFIASAIGFVLLGLAFDVAAALLFYLSPAMLVHSTLALSEPGAVALLAASLFSAPRSPALFGAFAALTVGWRPQFAVFVVPLLIVECSRKGSPFKRILVVFAVVCLAWLVPLAMSVGGIEKLIGFETGQAAYVAAHDAGVSRSGWTALGVFGRFIADPWGPAIVAWPLLIAAVIGLPQLWRKGRGVVIAAAAYIVFALLVMDPADGVRYAIPFTLLVALAAASVIRRYAVIVTFGAASVIYTSSLLVQRSTSIPPALQAASAIPHRAAVLYELPLWPHATYFLAGHPLDRVDDGLTRYFDDPRTAVWMYADGRSSVPGSRSFRWEPSDAYRKLTRNHYRVVSTIPLPPERRFRPLRGVYASEREPEGDEWRWLDQDAALELPRIPASALSMRFGLPRSAAFAETTVTISEDQTPIARVLVPRGNKIAVRLPLQRPGATLQLHSDHAYTPAAIAGSLNRDPRRLAVRLHDLVLRR